MTDEFDQLEALAADYVLGTLDAEERRRADDLLAKDARFAKLVEDWTERLSPLAEVAAPVAPPEQIWRNIETRISAQQMLARTTPAPARPPLLQSLSFWRWSTLAAGAVAAVLAAYIATGPLLLPGQEERYVAVLNEGPAKPAWLVTVDLPTRQLTIRPLTDVQVAENDLELWLVAGEDTPPQSLGLLSASGETSLPLSAVLREEVPAAAVLAVSLEPLGGSPTGLPTGPVIYQGGLLPIED